MPISFPVDGRIRIACAPARSLIEAGLVPDHGKVELALARNRMSDRGGYYARWIFVRVESSSCVFTRRLESGAVLPLPVAHGEGRFTSADAERMPALLAAGQVPLRYATADGAVAETFPANPNGAELAAAAVCNRAGNVLAMMPHPERAQDLGALARAVSGPWSERREQAMSTGQADAEGPGLALFHGLKRHLED
ncbi:MAG: phosphoribosylformylglycinamidine synthase subunit PurQ [Candidatus Eisenbacteria bacterium]|uniref:Phosphoribosylformylglycinamidine synthase subunit PurQ n=1 Tax=Eiseniibacteriota bacterium TaxID=2212470 RepID=A0A538U793_UNCEI|nr:MAG: phosphoribosylformylglycinamidine synthase subunit PurQ [Candidatus Eisenbacteria bacterium]